MTKPNKQRLNISVSQKRFLFKILNINNIDQLDVAVLKLLKDKLKSLTDSRQKNKITFKLWDIIMYVVIANFSNVFDWDDIELFVQQHYSWFKSFLQMTGGIPSSQTIERVFSLIDSKELEKLLTDFFISITYNNNSKIDFINIDGKVSRASSRNQTDFSDKSKPLNVLNAYSNNLGMCLASEMIDDKTNEIPTIPTILNRLYIKDTIVTWDALNTQKDNVKAVIDKFADYVVPIKGNHQGFYDDLILYFNEKKLEEIIAGNSKSSYIKQVEKSHSSIIIYEYFQTTDIDWYYDSGNWDKLHSIGLVKKTTITNGEEKCEFRYYISSLYLDIFNFSKAIRLHWSVENKLHWHLDFTFKDDKNTTANKQALMNLQIVNKFILAILSKVKPFYNNYSLKKIKTLLSFNFENNFIDLLCYLLLS